MFLGHGIILGPARGPDQRQRSRRVRSPAAGRIGWQLSVKRTTLSSLWLIAPFTHVVGYRPPAADLAGEVDTLLDPATNGSR